MTGHKPLLMGISLTIRLVVDSNLLSGAYSVMMALN